MGISYFTQFVYFSLLKEEEDFPIKASAISTPSFA